MLLILATTFALLVNRFVTEQLWGYSVFQKEDRIDFLKQCVYTIGLVIPLVLSSTTLKLFQRWIGTENKMNILQKENLKSELKALRNQINPHFLFNMLNSVNVLCNKNPAIASQVITKLSDCLRYQLYEANEEKVLLSSEIKFIEDLLNLELLRRGGFSFRVDYTDACKKGVWVGSHILVTFIENAIKDSAFALDDAYIHVKFSLEDNRLIFLCENSYSSIIRSSVEKQGVGLKNAIKRLRLIYGKNFSFVKKQEEGVFSVLLKIEDLSYPFES
ncbi:sensor histidine kinase [Sphingobacterium sp. LRF_L2]|uniref:sensor histidine kinase n=1 Tax=Sphingobacterium sp. LRF_L2 TaxID=3369421 RepID=UPI003F5D7242